MSKIAKSMAVLGVVAGLGVAALPLSTYAQTSGPVTIQAEVNSSIAVTAADELVDLGTINAGTPIHEKSTIVTVTGTGGQKYALTVEDVDDNTALTKVDDDGNYITNATTNQKIETGTNLAKGTSAWAFMGGDLNTWTEMGEKGSPVTIVAAGELAAAETEGGLTTNQTEVTFGVTAASGLENGIYKDQVVFSATIKN